MLSKCLCTRPSSHRGSSKPQSVPTATALLHKFCSHKLPSSSPARPPCLYEFCQALRHLFGTARPALQPLLGFPSFPSEFHPSRPRRPFIGSGGGTEPAHTALLQHPQSTQCLLRSVHEPQMPPDEIGWKATRELTALAYLAWRMGWLAMRVWYAFRTGYSSM